MNKKIISLLAAALAVVMVPVSALAAFSSTVLHNADYSLKENGIAYYEKSVSEGGKQNLFYGEYNTTKEDAEYEWVIHSNRNGNDTKLTTVMNLAKDYEQKTGRKVMLAANGDYFDFGSGSNMESYVNNGIVMSKGSFATKHCIGFDNNGKIVVGRMTQVERRLMIVLDGQRYFYEIDAFNTAPGENGIAIYTDPGTYTVNDAGKYVCGSTSSNLNQCPVWGSSRRMSTGTVTNNDSFTLKSGQFAVVVKGENAQFFYDNIKYGVEVDLVEIPAGEFAGCTWVLGGYDILVNNGKTNTNCHTDNSGNANAPRTFIGFKEDGTGFVCVVDGRGAGGAVGITVNKEAELAKALGAKFALELDGGGSSTMVVRINDQLTLRNKPSDGSMRAVSNAILLVEKEKPVEPEIPETPEVPENPVIPTTPSSTIPATNSTASTAAPAATTGTQPQNPNPAQPKFDTGVLVLVAAVGAVVIAVPVVIFVIRRRF